MNTGRVIFYDNNPNPLKDAVNKFDPTTISVSVVDRNEVVIQEPIPTRLSPGEYIASIREEALISGEHYEMRWLYGLYTITTNQMKRFEFTYNQTFPTISGMCAIHSNETKGGLGIINAKVDATLRRNGYTKLYDSEYTNTYTDVFGDWHIYMPVASVVTITVPEVNSRKYITVPSSASISLDSISILQTSVSTDAFGNVN